MAARVAALLCLLAPAAGRCPSAVAPGEHQRVLRVGGRDRTYYFKVPSAAGEQRIRNPRPAVIMLHGCGSSPEKFERESRMNEAAERRGWYNVYPEGTTTGTSLGWNAGSSTCQTGGLVNDVDFIRAVVQDVKDNLCVDTARVFAAGFSNGGSMTFNLTCETPDIFAAFSVTGMDQKSDTYPENCGLSPEQIRPMVAICGSTDFACAAGFGRFTEGYAQRSHCTDSPAERQVTATTTLTSHAKCGASGKQDFDAYSIAGLGHCWSGNDCCDSNCLNQNPANIDSSERVLDFFARAAHLRMNSTA
eukprot:TRINITY_DN47231_c0_g1_i1.p2 TRINITY_DN47231_c0_g1~~TRINITY_DN47231_c0_g1_i1.p2  ORF type:complete len:327 (+),score=108.59 TRINITY_DN47231_c0_g1_i1:70-981(+)